MSQKIYPRSNDKETVYLKSVITNPNIIVGDYTIYNDFAGEPKNFEKPEDVSGLSARVLRLFIRRIMPLICRLNQSMPHIDELCEGSHHNRFR